MINLYWQGRSFFNASLDEIEYNIQELNSIIAKSGTECHFYKNENFESFPMKKGTVGDFLFGSQINPQLSMRVIPLLLKRLSSIPEDFLQICDMDRLWPMSNNTIYGPHFDSADTCFYIKNEHEFNVFRSHVFLTTVSEENFDRYCRFYLTNVKLTKEALKMSNIYRYQVKEIFKLFVDINKCLCEVSDFSSFSIKNALLEMGIDISDESDSVKQNPKLNSTRLFKIPNIGSICCFHHIKIGDLRMYIHFDKQNGIIYVPYIGRHLSTKNY